MEPINVKSREYILLYFGIENNDKYPKFDVGDLVQLSEYKNIFEKGYILTQKFLWLKK